MNRWLKLKHLKKGDSFMLVDDVTCVSDSTRLVWVKGDKVSKLYHCSLFTDFSFCRFFSGEKFVYVFY